MLDRDFEIEIDWGKRRPTLARESVTQGEEVATIAQELNGRRNPYRRAAYLAIRGRVYRLDFRDGTVGPVQADDPAFHADVLSAVHLHEKPRGRVTNLGRDYAAVLLQLLPRYLPEVHAVSAWPVLSESGVVRPVEALPFGRKGLGVGGGVAVVGRILRPVPVEAARLAVDRLLSGWTFQSPTDKAHALALFLGPMLAIRPSPIGVVLGEAGAGKTTLINAVGALYQGEGPTPGATPYESAMRRDACLAREPGVLLLDNIAPADLESDAIKSIVTSRGRVHVRPVGRAGFMVRAPWAILSSGLAGEWGPEIERRALRVQLLPRATGSAEVEVDELIRERRDAVLACLASLVQCWHDAGRPPGPEKRTFGTWSRAVGGIIALHWPELGDALFAHAPAPDPTREAFLALVAAWPRKASRAQWGDSARYSDRYVASYLAPGEAWALANDLALTALQAPGVGPSSRGLGAFARHLTTLSYDGYRIELETRGRKAWLSLLCDGEVATWEPGEAQELTH